MVYAVLAVVEETCVGEERAYLSLVALVVETDSVAGDVSETYTAYRGDVSAEIFLQQSLAYTYRLEYLGAAV